MILESLASLTERGCHFTFIRGPSHSGVRGNMLADVADKEVATV